MEERLTDNRRTADVIRSLLLLGVIQTGTIAVYLAAARGAPGPLEALVLAAYTAYPFIFAGIVPQLSLPLVERAGTTIALGSTIAIVAATDGLRSPFLPVFLTIPSASFSASGAARIARLGVCALLGLGLVALLDLSGSLPAYGIAPEMLPRARAMLVAHSLAVMTILGLSLETARRSSLRELARSKKNAEAENEAKSDFLAMISHELRTPLAGLAGALSLALEETAEPETRARLSLAASCAESLRALLDELLDLSQIEAGQMTIRPEPVTPKTILREVTSLFTPAAEAKGIELRTKLGPGMELGVMLDALRMRQVIANLVSNSLKFTERGSITVTGDALNSGDDRLLRVEIRDTGVGMSSEQLARLFEPFAQVHERRAGSGTGLGLVISRSLIAQMGGTLELRSEPGVGTSARIELLLPAVDAPAPELAPKASGAQPKTDGRPLRVLIAEDTPVLRHVIASLLHREGCTTAFAGDGHEAVRALEAETFDLVLMDVHMPELDGLEATRQIRALGPATATIPIYGLSAGAFASNKEEALSAGMTGYLVKPVQARDLQALLATVRSEGTCAAPDSTGGQPSQPR